MTNQSLSLSNFLLPAAPPAEMVLQAIEEGLVEISPDQATELLEQWDGRWSWNNEKQEVASLIECLLDQGATPWRDAKIVDRWIEGGRVELVRSAFEIRQPDPLSNVDCLRWIDLALVRKNATMLDLLLSKGVRQVVDVKGNSPLHKVKDSQSAKLLMAYGANASLKNASGKFPIEGWETPWSATGSQYSPLARTLGDFCVDNMQTTQGLYQPGFDAAPLLLAGFGDVRLALALAGLTPSGCEVVSCVGFEQGASILSGWCWSVHAGQERRPASRTSRRLLDACFSAREGTFDHEWVFAVAALDVMEQSRAGGIASLAAPIRARQKELMERPALDGSDRNRWQVAVQSLPMWMDQRRDAMSGLAKKSLERFFTALCAGRDMPVDLASIEEMNNLAANASGLMSAIASSQWSRDIPKSFWNQQNDTCPGWVQKAPQVQGPIIAHLKSCINENTQPPRNIVATSSWPKDAVALLEASQLNSSTPAAQRVSISRRM